MSLDDLSASELARIDSVCLDYESRYRRGSAPEIAELVSQYGWPSAELLRRELELVRDELQSDATIFGANPGERPTTITSFRLPEPGTELGPYIVGETIGRGGMGVVLAAIDQRLGRRVAIKMLATGVAMRRDLTERFDREARAVAAISHPNIVELFDVGSYDGLPYAVMEYLDGELLSDRLSRSKFSVEETRHLGAQIADALTKAHEAGVIHRDLKPRNIMLVSGGESADDASEKLSLVKLFDFGLSRAPRESGGSDDDTQDGVIMGTPGYMAPEQALGESATPAADTFALGCILFESFYGKRAFEGTSVIQRHQATLVAHPEPDPIRRRDDIDLAMLIDQCLAKDPSDRPSSSSLIAKRLRQRGPAVDPIAERMQSGTSVGRYTRRRLLELTAGGAAGGLIAAFLAAQSPNKLSNIRSIGVLSFADDSESSKRLVRTSLEQPGPIGGSELGRGEELSALLVHELTQIPGIRVPPFRPLVANSPSEYRKVGEMLKVDALLGGSIRTEVQGTKRFLKLDVQIVSSKDGTELWGDIIRADASDTFLQQSQFASRIASEIGHRLTSTVNEERPPSPESFQCLVDGKVRYDPDSREGLEMALKCFFRAHEADIRFADPLAGIALTSITLAAQSPAQQSLELIQQARDKSTEALQRSPNSIDARLATAMLDWQTVERYEHADQLFRKLRSEAPNNWQIHHQYGLLQLATGRTKDALVSMRQSTLLNPLSVTVKMDLARAHWFVGDTDGAIEEATRVRDKFNKHPLAVGLLIDIYEQQGKFDKAAAQQNSFVRSTAEGYLVERRKHLLESPYGPFGDKLNGAILQARSSQGIDSNAFADLVDPLPPMLSLILAMHPSFRAVRELPRAKEMLSGLEIG